MSPLEAPLDVQVQHSDPELEADVLRRWPALDPAEVTGMTSDRDMVVRYVAAQTSLPEVTVAVMLDPTDRAGAVWFG